MVLKRKDPKGFQLYSTERNGIINYGQTHIIRPLLVQPQKVPIPVKATDLHKLDQNWSSIGLHDVVRINDDTYVFPNKPVDKERLYWGKYRYKVRMAIVNGKDHYATKMVTKKESDLWLEIVETTPIKFKDITDDIATKYGLNQFLYGSELQIPTAFSSMSYSTEEPSWALQMHIRHQQKISSTDNPWVWLIEVKRTDQPTNDGK